MWRPFRDAAIFVLGMAVGINEVFLSPPPDQNALIFAAACLGLPFALRQDEKRK